MSFAIDEDQAKPASRCLVSVERPGASAALAVLNTTSGEIGSEAPVRTGEIVDAQADTGMVVYEQTGHTGLRVEQVSLATGACLRLLALNSHLGKVTWGERRLIRYTDDRGIELNAAVLLPPGFEAGRRYPTLVWVYGGH
ncbi:hypothetical protein [uncultured Bradyrhizobium sp.]|uniref:hypothetical protein n=1 Tax=uncultured Bradyrhizobium sp. TaxID=199684 RepID=UPI002608C365|nr:hypothetical protein [uncultured Bradyrhizobium sp.]